MYETEKLLKNNDLDGLKELRRKGELDYGCMTTLAIYKNMKMLNLIYGWAVQDNLKDIKYSPMDEFMTSVLQYLVRNLEEPEHKDFLNLVRKTQKLNYDSLILYVLNEYLAPKKLFLALDLLIEYAN